MKIEDPALSLSNPRASKERRIMAAFNLKSNVQMLTIPGEAADLTAFDNKIAHVPDTTNFS